MRAKNNEITQDKVSLYSHTHKVFLTAEQMSLIEWGLNTLMTPPTKHQLTYEDVEKVEELLELLNDC